MTPSSWQLIDLYGHYKRGFLPVAGGLLDQPAVFVRSMSIIENLVAKNERHNR